MGQGPSVLTTATQSFLVALAFLTVLPIRLRALPALEVVARSRHWYPLVGLLLGGLLGGGTWLVARLGAPLPAAFLVLLAWVGLTGALHLDGVCDVCDGLFGGKTPEDRLRIMKDPHLGTFGLAGGVLLLLGKFAVIHQALAQPIGPWAIGSAVVVARCLTLVVAAGAAYPRAEGTGKALIEATRWWEAWPMLVVALLVAVWALGDVRAGSLAVGVALSAVIVLRWLCSRRLGGITGDCLGAGIELAELTFLLAAVF